MSGGDVLPASSSAKVTESCTASPRVVPQLLHIMVPIVALDRFNDYHDYHPSCMSVAATFPSTTSKEQEDDELQIPFGSG